MCNISDFGIQFYITVQLPTLLEKDPAAHSWHERELVVPADKRKGICRDWRRSDKMTFA